MGGPLLSGVLAEGKARRQPPDGVPVAPGQSRSTMDEPKARSWQAHLYSTDEGTDVGRFLTCAGDHGQRTVI
jgi:hypothetical protein